jgi:hypothetical protein
MNSFTFSNGQSVRGVVYGKFVVLKSERSKLDGKEIVTCREIGPQGQQGCKVRLPVDILVAC